MTLVLLLGEQRGETSKYLWANCIKLNILTGRRAISFGVAQTVSALITPHNKLSEFLHKQH
jgi:hypothetical protein